MSLEFTLTFTTEMGKWPGGAGMRGDALFSMSAIRRPFQSLAEILAKGPAPCAVEGIT
jgi:hypothetical protein